MSLSQPANRPQGRPWILGCWALGAESPHGPSCNNCRDATRPYADQVITPLKGAIRILILTFFLSLLVNMLLTCLVLRIAKKKQWLDPPNHRSVHTDPVPRLGGVGLFASVTAMLGGLLTLTLFGISWLSEGAWTYSAFLLFLGLASTHVLGLVDDFIQLRAIYKFPMQVLGALLALGAGLTIDQVTIPGTALVIPFGVFAPFVTVLWIVGVTNSVNLIDGMDGLAGGFSTLTLAVLGFYSSMAGNGLAAVVCFSVAGALVAFLVFNLPPAKIFMGDSGSLMLGYLLAVVPLWGGEKSLIHQFWFLPIVLVLFPVGDTLAAIMRRLRLKQPIWSPDREHSHHKLLALGHSPRSILVGLLGMTALTTLPVFLAGVTWNNPEYRTAVWISSGSAMFLVAIFFARLHWAFRKHFPYPVITQEACVHQPTEQVIEE